MLSACIVLGQPSPHELAFEVELGLWHGIRVSGIPIIGLSHVEPHVILSML